jgi:hypothetical protein
VETELESEEESRQNEKERDMDLGQDSNVRRKNDDGGGGGQKDMDKDVEVLSSGDGVSTAKAWMVEHVLFKGLRQWYVPSKEISLQSAIVQIAELSELYKVFERC